MIFDQLLSPAVRRRLTNERKLIRDLFAASDLALAQSLLAQVRQCRQLRPDYHAMALRHYGAVFAWLDIPDIAWLLARQAGQTLLLAHGEGQGPLRAYFLAGRAADFRNYAGVMLKNTGHLPRVAGLAEDDIDPWDLLTGEPCNGNPVAFAVDRLAPPTPDAQDPLATEIRGIADRRGHGLHVSWSPALNTVRLDAPIEA